MPAHGVDPSFPQQRPPKQVARVGDVARELLRRDTIQAEVAPVAVVTVEGGRQAESERWAPLLRERSPRGEEHGHLLWTRWRSGLPKNDAPGPDVAVAHLEPNAPRIFVNPGKKLLLDLESLWDEYEGMVDLLIDAGGADDTLRNRVLSRWAVHDWSVGMVSYVAQDAFALLPASASFTSSVTRASGTGLEGA